MGKLIVQRGRFSRAIPWAQDTRSDGVLFGRGFHCDYIVPDRFVDCEQVRLLLVNASPNTSSALSSATALDTPVLQKASALPTPPEGALCHLQVLAQTNPVLINGKVVRSQM